MRLIFKCKTVTPMAMSGADKKKVELRPPSFKGMLRFWWRALYGNLTLDKLRENEGRLFGTSDEDIGRSPFSIIIREPNIWDGYETRLLPHSEDSKKKFKSPALKVNQEFEIMITGINISIIEKIKNIFKLTLILGGFGKRSRRGFGSVEILSIKDERKSNEVEDIQYSLPNDPSEILDKIMDLINSININRYTKNSKSQEITRYFSQQPPPNEYPFVEKIEIGKEYKTTDELLIKIGQASHDNNCDYTGFARGGERFASPVYVSVIKVGSKYRPIITTLACHPKNPIVTKKMDEYIDKSNKFKKAILI